MAAPTGFRVFSPKALNPEEAVLRSGCAHSPSILAQAMRSLTEMHDLPDFTTKKGLKQCYENREEIIPILLDCSHAHTNDVHLAAAAHIQLAMVALDGQLGEELDTYIELTSTISEALQSPCDFRLMAGLTLLIRALANADYDRLIEFSSDVIPLVENLIVGTAIEDLVLELSLDAWTSWATLVQHEEEDDRSPLIDRMECLAMACRDTNRRQVAAHILRRLQRVTCTTNVLALRPDDARPMQKFFMAALRYDSASDRLTALRAYYHAFDPGLDELDDDTMAHPLTFMTAEDYTCITGETEFYGLDTTRSDAKHLLNVRAEFLDSMRAFCLSRDFHSLGETLYDLLIRDPRSVNFSARSIQQFAGGKQPEEFHIPIRAWSDVLRQCADVLSACSQAASGHNHRQAANILQLKYHLVRHDLDAVMKLASKLVVQQGTSVPWYSYALSHCPDDDALFRVFEILVTLDASGAQHGPSPVITMELYQCCLVAVSLSSLSWVLVRNVETKLTEHWKSLSDLGAMAEWAATEYLKVAAFDGQFVAVMNEVIIVLETWRHRPVSCTSPTGGRTFPFEARWRAASAVHARIWSRTVDPLLRIVVTSMYADWAEAVRLYEPALAHHLLVTPPPSRADEPKELIRGDIYAGTRGFSRVQLDAWRALINGKDAKTPRARAVCWRDAPSALLHQVMQFDYKLAMRTCGSCGLGSVVLRLCGACRVARYCSKECQADDWVESHKRTCARTYV